MSAVTASVEVTGISATQAALVPLADLPGLIEFPRAAPEAHGGVNNLDWLLAQLIAEGVARTEEDPVLIPLPRNTARADAHEKRTFVVWTGRKPRFHLTVAPALRDQWTRLNGFATAVPHLVCAPRFFFHRGALDFLGRDYFPGASVEELLQTGAITADEAAAIVARAGSGLVTTEEASSPRAAVEELAAFEQAVLALRAWSEFDRVYLHEVVLPRLREHLPGTGPFRRRWTNGDFIARNLLVGPTGAVRIVDYEFAACTHFGSDDQARFAAYSEVPDAVKQRFAPPPAGGGIGAKLYFLLNQARLTEATLPADVARGEIAPLATRLMELLAPGAGRRADLFHAPGAAASGMRIRQQLELFWAPAVTAFCAEARASAWLEADAEQTARFTIAAGVGVRALRLDPGSESGLVHIAAITVRTAAGSPVLRLTTAADFDGVVIEGTAVRVPVASGLLLFSTGNDPQIRLPLLPETMDAAIEVEVVIRWDADLCWVNAHLPFVRDGWLGRSGACRAS